MRKSATCRLDYFSVGSENLLKNITYEILQECQRSNISVDEVFASYAISFLSLDPCNGLQLSSQFDQCTLENFMKMCIEKLADTKDPSMQTLGIQAKFITHPVDQAEIVADQREKLRVKMLKLTKEIMDTHTVTKEDRDKLFKKLAIDIVIYHGMGNPSNSKIISETVQALHSIMSKNDLQSFVGLNRTAKTESLQDIRDIICGIRAFNRDAGHPSEGVINLPEFIEQTCSSTKTMLDISLYETMNRVNILTTSVTLLIEFETGADEFAIPLPENMTKDDFEILKSVLIFNRQMELYLRQLLDQLAIVEAQVKAQLTVFKRVMESVHHSVQYKTAVPTEHVFPKFKELGRIWNQLHNQMYVLSHINYVNNYFTVSAEEIENYDDIAYPILKGHAIETDKERLECYKDQMYDRDNYTDDGTIVEYQPGTKIELLGFCVNSIAECNGVLTPGNPKIGLGLYKNKYYSSCSIKGLQNFQENPEKMIYDVVQAARMNPELIVFLDIFEQVKNGEQEFAGKIFTNKMLLSDVGVQTELHPVPFCKDKDYAWNVWDLRRRAIQLANLRGCRTKSAQTNFSFLNAGAKTQTYSPRVKSAQTRKSCGAQATIVCREPSIEE